MLLRAWDCALLLCAALAALALAPRGVSGAHYLPGVQVHSFVQYDEVPLLVSKLTSTRTQIPFDYYALPYCEAPDLRKATENIGEVLAGDRIETSGYKLHFKYPQACQVVCLKQISSEKEVKQFRHAITEDYRVHWLVDNLNVGMNVVADEGSGMSYFTRGFPVGFVVANPATGQTSHYLYNHIRIVIQYNEPLDEEGQPVPEGGHIVGFRVEPFSLRHEWEGEFDPETTVLRTCNAMTQPVNSPSSYQQIDTPTDVLFTYDVHWEESDTPWSHRWDVYLNSYEPDKQVHWFSITNSTIIVLFLNFMISMILVRALRRDIQRYNDPGALEEAKEEYGWKLVHADVFRPPKDSPMLFAVLVGTGMQLLFMAVVTLTLALFGLLSPANRGGLLTVFVLLFVFMGVCAGYVSSRIYKMFRGTDWLKNTIMTAFLYPGLVFAIFFLLNLALWSEGSSGAVPFMTLFNLLFLWFGVSVPLVFVGSFFGYKKAVIEHPVRTNQIPRQIPPQPWYMNPVFTIVVAGILPFGAVSVELYFVMSALWLHRMIYIFGFLFLVMIILIATCADVSILLCYFQLCQEDYHWWWRSFLSAGASAFYVLLYSCWYYLTELELDGFVPTMLYFGYMTISAITFFLITGTIGYHACFWFTRSVYASIKVD